jgi:pimeloyl-ACP methyl ester carboxylesterase
VRSNDPIALALAEHFEVIAPVHPGYRDLDELADLRDVRDLALYHDDLLGALGLDRVTIVGHSFGAMVAAELAAHVRARVALLVLISPTGLWRDDEPAADLFGVPLIEIQELLWSDSSSPEAQAALGALASAPDEEREVDDPLLNLLLGMVKGLTTVGKFTWPLPDKGLRRRLRRISAPTLVLHGAKDKLVPVSYAADLAAGVADGRLEVVVDAGHMLPYERTAAVVEAIAGFVRPDG